MKFLKILSLIIFVATAIYLVLPSPAFPPPPPNTLRSTEPADTESIYRRAYFTNLTREEIMAYYWQQFGGWGVKLNLPPEDAYSMIRDQTQSNFLEEFVHPGREALFVNGYVPTKPSEQINRNGVHYLNKITVRMVPSHPLSRLTVLLGTAVVIYLLFKEYKYVK